ncbi:hypothetical protein A2U01_0088735, partial [Trifolium medium]|nr:hypothetical protein [Trifolium medium]
SPAHNQNSGAAGGCEVDHDAASCGGGCGAAAAAWAVCNSLTAL